MLKRALALNHVITNLEMMSSETGVWNVMDQAEKKLDAEIREHAKEHEYDVGPSGVTHLWTRREEPGPCFVLTAMVTLQKEENAASK